MLQDCGLGPFQILLAYSRERPTARRDNLVGVPNQSKSQESTRLVLTDIVRQPSRPIAGPFGIGRTRRVNREPTRLVLTDIVRQPSRPTGPLGIGTTRPVNREATRLVLRTSSDGPHGLSARSASEQPDQ